MITNFSQTVSISPDALFQVVNKEAVILDLKSESYFGLNEIGTRIWQLLEATNSLQQIFDTLVHEYDVPPNNLEKDIKNLLNELLNAGLVKINEE